MERDPTVDPQMLISAILEEPAYNCKNRGPRTSTEEALDEIHTCLKENEKKRQTGRSKQQMLKNGYPWIPDQKGVRYQLFNGETSCEKTGGQSKGGIYPAGIHAWTDPRIRLGRGETGYRE